MTARQERLFTRADAENTGHFTPYDWALFTSISLIWGSSFLFIAYGLEGLRPGMITLGRVGLGAAVLWAMRLTRHPDTRLRRDDRMRVLVLSIVWVGVPFTLFPLAQEHINSAVTGLLNGGVPIFAAVVSTVLLRVAPGRTQLAGILIGFAGIVLISVGSGGDDPSEALGVVLVLAATVCYGFAMNMAAPLQQRYGAVTLMSSVLGLATIFVTPFGLWDLGANEWRPGPVASVVVLGAIGTGIAYWIMSSLVGRVGAIRASFITYLIPVVSLVLGVVFRSDEVTSLALAGAALTIAGALLASRRASV